MRSILAACGVVAALLVVGIAPAASQSIPEAGVPEAGGIIRAEPNMIIWNMCNGAGQEQCGTLGSNGPGVDLFRAMENDPVRPLAVGTQEMCKASFHFLRGQLLASSWGSAYGARTWRSNEPNSDCEWHLNGMFWGGGDRGREHPTRV